MSRDTAIHIDADALDRLTASMGQFLAEASVRGAFLVDRSGQLLTTAGATSGVDHASFASLAAADFAASGQLAELLGEEEFTSLYHQGEVGSMLLVDIGGHAILAALFDKRTTLGMVRLRMRAVVPELSRLFEEGQAGQRDAPRPDFSGDWAREASDEIDRLFGE